MVELSPVMTWLTFAALLILGAVYAVACCHYVAEPDDTDTIDEHAEARRALSAARGSLSCTPAPRPVDWEELGWA